MNFNPLLPLDKLAVWWCDWRSMQKMKDMPDVQIKKLEVTGDKLAGIFVSPMIAYFANDAAKMLLSDPRIQNYLEVELMPSIDQDTHDSIILTVQWAHGLTPAQKYKLLEAQYKTATENQELLYQVIHHLIAGITNVNYLDACVELVEELLNSAGYPEMAEALRSGEAASAVGLFDGEVDNEE